MSIECYVDKKCHINVNFLREATKLSRKHKGTKLFKKKGGLNHKIVISEGLTNTIKPNL